MAVAAILKNQNHNKFAMGGQILTKFGTMMHLASPLDPVM